MRQFPEECVDIVVTSLPYNLESMSEYHWERRFKKLFKRCLKRYRKGQTNFSKVYKPEDEAFLKSIGYKPREFFDFVEDYAEEGVPSLETAIMVAAVRRDYLRTIQKGVLSEGELTEPELPARDEELGGYRWLPRIIAKARGKLRGELDPEIMYCCGGDRGFLKEQDIHPADFLRAVWAADGDDAKILQYVEEAPGKGSGE